ncbi:hypothetical protein [Xanthomonas bonasiae]|uniref:hypothetical protein n=1 Tax=Xanthomonas bonasiae TaxID=2810351 RepID=UPI00177B7E23|nr:hypothetical protein [Xanthomonas surreyensis]MBD7921436.1 hypothetical protein [Xanthomonas surreyensis]
MDYAQLDVIAKNFAKVTAMIFALAGCASTSTATRARPEFDYYNIIVSDNVAKKRFDIVFESYDSRPLCVSVENWPSSSGHFMSDNENVFVKSDDVVLPEKSKLLSAYCPGGCGEHRVRQGGSLRGFISYDVFGDAERLAEVSKILLNFKVFPYCCH